MTAIVPSGKPGDQEIESLRSRAAELEALADERAAELARMDREVAAFTMRYRQHVGLLHEELEDLERAISDAELGERARQTANRPPPAGEARTTVRSEHLPQFTSDAVRKLFRDVAKAVHPDLARDDVARDRRHLLMVEANRAYILGDEERLRSILQSWEQSPEAVQGSDPDAARLRFVRRIAQLEEQLTMLQGELESLKETPMWKLKTMVDEAGARGKDLVRDMVGRLKRDIMVAKNRLDAIQSIS